ncbi:hypothetical protein [Burkholderia sp. AU6039]|uniref:hypothetical protein n=1 Tax=Burkholderia sp. AU6039 TaxID=2015344 RepID=UPI001180D096|nr:hypothetical protein [Burkholderia sp. AU6039]
MMLHLRAQYAIERGQPLAQSNRLPFRHFPENDLLLENVTTAGDGPTVASSSYPVFYRGHSRLVHHVVSRHCDFLTKIANFHALGIQNIDNLLRTILEDRNTYGIV